MANRTHMHATSHTSPHFPSSLSHFMYHRFGVIAQAAVVLISIFSMSIALLAEYTAMGSLFKDYVGAGSSLPIILVLGVLTIVYTTYGGLRVSIVTDRIQVGPCLCVCMIAGIMRTIVCGLMIEPIFVCACALNDTAMGSLFIKDY